MGARSDFAPAQPNRGGHGRFGGILRAGLGFRPGVSRGWAPPGGAGPLGKKKKKRGPLDSKENLGRAFLSGAGLAAAPYAPLSGVGGPQKKGSPKKLGQLVLGPDWLVFSGATKVKDSLGTPKSVGPPYGRISNFFFWGRFFFPRLGPLNGQRGGD